jgi:hypothetical protein
MQRNLGLLLLAVLLILFGLISLFNLHFNGEYIVVGILALAAGVLLIVRPAMHI